MTVGLGEHEVNLYKGKGSYVESMATTHVISDSMEVTNRARQRREGPLQGYCSTAIERDRLVERGQCITNTTSNSNNAF